MPKGQRCCYFCKFLLFFCMRANVSIYRFPSDHYDDAWQDFVGGDKFLVFFQVSLLVSFIKILIVLKKYSKYLLKNWKKTFQKSKKIFLFWVILTLTLLTNVINFTLIARCYKIGNANVLITRPTRKSAILDHIYTKQTLLA